MGQDAFLPLFETRAGKGRIAYQLLAISVFLGICMIWVFRVSRLPPAEETEYVRRWAWIGLFMAELWFSFYWFLSQFARWNPIYRSTFKHRLSQRYDKDLPGVDIFVCTADPTIEPPIMVVNTVLSVMAYDYPPEKLSIYLSDDTGSELTFYALLEASRFAKHWLPFCKKFKVEPRSPAAYFSTIDRDDQQLVGNDDGDHLAEKEYQSLVKKFYEEMRDRIEIITRLAQIPADTRDEHKGFREWDLVSTADDHPAILQILIDGREPKVVHNENHDQLPTLVYLSREKRPKYHHNFKAGAMNSLVEIAAMDANGGPCYIGSGCFHRRESLCGMKYSEDYCGGEWRKEVDINEKQSAIVLEDMCKVLASCTYEDSTQWGKEMGVKYGFPVEDMVTGLSIQCRGWKSVYFNPQRPAFTGVAPIALLQALVQQKRWSEGQFQIFLSKYSPLIYGHGKISLELQVLYTLYMLWAPNCLPTLYYVIVPSLFLLRGISLFPEITSLWILPFAYVIIAKFGYSLAEFVACGGTPQGWWNEQRMWLFRRTTSFFFAFLETMLRPLGSSELGFVVTSKVSDEEVYQRYLLETMEFGSPSPMFMVLSTIAMINLLSFVWGLKKMIMNAGIEVLEQLGLQILLCGVIVLINLPVYQGLFFRRDKGKMPSSVMYKSVMLALLACTVALCYN